MVFQKTNSEEAQQIVWTAEELIKALNRENPNQNEIQQLLAEIRDRSGRIIYNLWRNDDLYRNRK